MSVILHFEVDQGTTIRHRFYFYEGNESTPFDISGFAFRMKIRRSIGGEELIDCTPYLEIDTHNEGVLLLEIPDAISTALEPLARVDETIDGVYDLEAVNQQTNSVTRPYRGNFNFVREVTRSGD